MATKHKLFDELKRGVDAIQQHHEGETTLLSSEIEDIPTLKIDADLTFGRLILAQDSGDAAVLIAYDRPEVRLHLYDAQSGVGEVVAALGRMGR